jgi:hypothetical protein
LHHDSPGFFPNLKGRRQPRQVLGTRTETTGESIKMSPNSGPAPRANRLATLYVATWGILAAAAVAYLVILAIRPDVGSGIVTRVTPTQPEPTQAQRTISKALADMQSIRQSVAEAWTQIGALKDTVSKQEDQRRAVTALGHEVAELRTSMASQDERGRVLAARLAAVESRQTSDGMLAQVRASLPDSSRGQSHELPGVTITGSVEERTTRASSSEARSSPPTQAQRASEETEQKTAVATAQAAFGTPKVISSAPKAPTIAGPVGLQLATGPTADALRLAWLRVSSGHKDTLQGLEPRYAEAKTPTGVIYRLIAGPVGNSDQAARLCADLKSKKVNCAVASYTGQPL